MRVVRHPEVPLELEASALWYEDRQPGLDGAFLEEYPSTLRSAVIYTLAGSCRRRSANPFDYLKDLFTQLPGAKITETQQFTPREWAKAKAGEKIVQAA